MSRLIKRYGSRKLYDTSESRYVSLEDLAAWVREGQEVQVLDNSTSEDVTVATLTQVISEEGRKGQTFLPSDLLHNLIRIGGQAVSSRVRKFQTGVDRLVKNSIDHLVPVSGVREEMNILRKRLDELESALTQAEHSEPAKVESAVEESATNPKEKAVSSEAKSSSASKVATAEKPAKTNSTRTRKKAAGTKAPKKTVAKLSKEKQGANG